MIIIDGYNFIKCSGFPLPKNVDLVTQREHLLKILQSSPILRGKHLLIVFDGGQNFPLSKNFRGKNIEVIFSGKHKKADDVIQDIIRKKASTTHLEIISSDRAIINTARDHGAKFLTSQEFWRKIQSRYKKPGEKNNLSEEKEKSLSEEEVKEWILLFKNRQSEDET